MKFLMHSTCLISLYKLLEPPFFLDIGAPSSSALQLHHTSRVYSSFAYQGPLKAIQGPPASDSWQTQTCLSSLSYVINCK